MAFRNNMRRNDRNFDRNNYGGSISRNVNPWGDNSGMGMARGGGMMPQGGGGGGGGGGNSNGLNADTLSLANSLISNLLRNQNQNSVPPSLMDLPPSDMRGGYGHGGGGGGGGSGYRDYDDYDRFDNRMGRPIGNRNAGPGPNRNRRPGGGARTNALKGGVRKPNPKDRAKNILAKNSNSNSTKTDTSAVNPNLNKEKSADENGKENSQTETKGQKLKRRDSLYSNIPNDLFYCHMCMKHMWDSTSFENHIKGRSHQMMKDGIEESYRLRANMIRQEAKIMEQLKSIEVDRIKRLGKNLKASNQHRDYCTMCDLHFYGNLSAHRKTDGHLNLKKFLHPKCNDCSTEFPNRTDYDDHVLSPGHMQKLATKSTRHDNKKKNQLNILTEVDELPGLKQEREEKKEKTEEGATEKSDGTANNETDKEGGEDDEVKEKKEKVEGEAETEAETTAAPVEEEPADVILDYVEGNVIPIEIDNKIPKYNCNRAIASGMIAKLECYECRICARFFDTEKTAEIHSRTIHHYRQFLKLLNEKSNETKIAQKRAEAAAEEEERRKRQKIEDDAEKMDEDKDLNGSELYDPSEATVDEEENKTTDETVTDEMKKNGDCWEEIDGAIKTESEKVDEVEEVKKEPEPMIVEESIAPVEEPTVVKEEATPAVEIKPEPEVVTPVVSTPAATPTSNTSTPSTPAQTTPSKPAPLMQNSNTTTPTTPMAQRQQPQRNNNHNNRQNSNRNRGGGRGRYNRY